MPKELRFLVWGFIGLLVIGALNGLRTKPRSKYSTVTNTRTRSDGEQVALTGELIDGIMHVKRNGSKTYNFYLKPSDDKNRMLYSWNKTHWEDYGTFDGLESNEKERLVIEDYVLDEITYE